MLISIQNNEPVCAGSFNRNFEIMHKTMSNVTSNVERKKNTLDLRPALEFVNRHLDRYEANFLRFISGQPSTSPNLKEIAYQNPMMYLNSDKLDNQPQVTPADIQKILPHIPMTFQRLSQLEKVDYGYNGIVPVPVFEQDGSWHNVEFVPANEFPRVEDHPSRILIGRSDGRFIYPSALPASISSNDRCRWFYQLHVFLHEFFHTIEYLRRSKEQRGKIILESKHGKRFTFQQWWSQWEDEFAPTMKLPFATRYAATYTDDLNWDRLEKEPVVFTRALAEQICESFVGYILEIAPNDQDNPDFKDHSPGAWCLINDLAESQVM